MSYEKKIPESRIDEVVRLYLKDWSVSEIGDALRFQKGAIWDLLVSLGFDPYCERPKRGRRPVEFDVERALEMKRDGKSYEHIAKVFGTSKGCMRNRLKVLL